MQPVSSIPQNLAAIKAQIAQFANQAGREPKDINLVAVSKTAPVSAISEAIAAGQRVFGENRVQEAILKFPALRATHPDLCLHLIGPLQTNKVGDALEIAQVIETLDRPKLSDAIARAVDKGKNLPRLMVQINLGDEPQKSGISWMEADDFILASRARFGAQLCGVMGIAPLDADPMPYFTRLAKTARQHRLCEISMGMSGDFAQAIAAGATHVRIGSAIFGARN